MMRTWLRLSVLVLVFVVVILPGSRVWLTIAGTPYGIGGAMGIHGLTKLLAYLALIVVIVATVGGGALYSAAISGEAPAGSLWLHRIAPWLAGVCAAGGSYLRGNDLRADERRHGGPRVSGVSKGVTQ